MYYVCARACMCLHQRHFELEMQFVQVVIFATCWGRLSIRLIFMYICNMYIHICMCRKKENVCVYIYIYVDAW